MMMVDVCIQPGYFMPFSVRDKTCSYKWFTEEHFSVSVVDSDSTCSDVTCAVAGVLLPLFN